MDFTQADTFNQAIRLIGQAHQRLGATFLADLDMHFGHALCLLELDAHGPRTQVQLAVALGVEPPSITSIVTKLQAVGLITRAPPPHDARAMIVTLTDQGRALLSQVKDIWVQLAEAMVVGLDTATLDRLCTDLVGLSQCLSLDNPPRSPTTAPVCEDS